MLNWHFCRVHSTTTFFYTCIYMLLPLDGNLPPGKAPEPRGSRGAGNAFVYIDTERKRYEATLPACTHMALLPRTYMASLPTYIHIHILVYTYCLAADVPAKSMHTHMGATAYNSEYLRDTNDILAAPMKHIYIYIYTRHECQP